MDRPQKTHPTAAADGFNSASLKKAGVVAKQLRGVPEALLADKGSANISMDTKRLLDALGIKREVHTTHHAY